MYDYIIFYYLYDIRYWSSSSFILLFLYAVCLHSDLCYSLYCDIFINLLADQSSCYNISMTYSVCRSVVLILDRQYRCYMLLLCKEKEGYQKRQEFLNGLGYDLRNVIYKEHVDIWNTFKQK